MKKEETNDNSFGICSVILGILSIVFFLSNGIILSIIGLVFSFQQQKRTPNKWGKAGKILSIIGFVVALLGIIVVTYLLKTNPILFQNLIA